MSNVATIREGVSTKKPEGRWLVPTALVAVGLAAIAAIWGDDIHGFFYGDEVTATAPGGTVYHHVPQKGLFEDPGNFEERKQLFLANPN